jgi:proteasome lid subunit RPN8/RPN11
VSPVNRLTPLPVGTPRGRLVVSAVVLEATQRALAEVPFDVPHESLVWWLGRKVGDDTVVVSLIRPHTDSTPQSVMVSEVAAGLASRRAREFGLGVVAQIHTHPGTDTRHSDGDDELIFMPFEGMFSIVVAEYGRGRLDSPKGFSAHQFQDGRWVLLDQPADAIIVVPVEVSL